MKEYYFLSALAILWTVLATIQDLKKREIANWLNFSLITFAFAYRAFYSVIAQNIKFFILGLSGFAIFFTLAHLFYYTKAFAGGDAKLMMGLGIILPYTNYSDLISLSLIFLFLIFAVGSIYTLLYSIIIVAQNKIKFKKEFKKLSKKYKYLLIISSIIFIITFLYSVLNSITILLALVFLLPFLYIYTKSLDTCMIKLISPDKLTEGDWLEQNIKLKNMTIKKTVHGLSQKEIKILKKAKKNILIKEGIPFTPAFLLSLLIMVFFSSDLLASFSQIFPF